MVSACARSAPRIGWVWPCALACAALTMPSPVSVVHAQDAPPSSITSTAVAFKPEPPLSSYVAIRRLESANERHNKAAWLVVRTCLKDGVLTWDVLEEGGSELIRKRVLRETLEREVAGHRRRSGRSRGGLTAGELHVLRADRPRRAACVWRSSRASARTCSCKGEMLLSPEGTLLRVEGDLVKRPSFWTKSVHLIRQYGRVEGTHVPLRIDIVAQVRLVGTSRLSMTYRYLEINGRPVRDVSGETSLLTRATGVACAVAVTAVGLS